MCMIDEQSFVKLQFKLCRIWIQLCLFCHYYDSFVGMVHFKGMLPSVMWDSPSLFSVSSGTGTGSSTEVPNSKVRYYQYRQQYSYRYPSSLMNHESITQQFLPSKHHTSCYSEREYSLLLLDASIFNNSYFDSIARENSN